MSKNKNKDKAQHNPSKPEGESKPKKERKPRETKSFTVRQRTKADLIVARSMELAEAAEKRGISEPLAALAKTFLTSAVELRNAYQQLEASGWQPSGKTATVTINPGDLVVVKAEHRPVYDYIPGLVSGVVVLVAGKAIPAGRSQMIQVTSEEGVPYGYIHRAHLARAPIAGADVEPTGEISDDQAEEQTA